MTSSSTEKEVHICKCVARKFISQRCCVTGANSLGHRRDGPVNAIRMRELSSLYTSAAKAGPDICSHPMKPSDTLIGIAISGGGSRAALFGAAGLEALAKVQVGPPAHSLLEDVSMISSVSGGSMATSYFAAVKPRKDVPILTASGELSTEYQTFFAQYKKTMNQDYESPLFWRNMTRLRWFNPAWTARSLNEHLNKQFLNDVTFKDVRERELSGEIPRLLINTTLYNDGRRFVITTLPQEQTQYDLLKDVSRASRWSPSFEGIRRADESQMGLAAVCHSAGAEPRPVPH